MDSLVLFWQEYRHIVALIVCIWFHVNCQIHRRFLTTPTDYYVWGMLTIGITIYFQNLPMG